MLKKKLILFRHILFVLMSVLVLQGCAANRPVEDTSSVFFPPPPNEPRLQYLTHIENSKDFLGTDSKVSLFVYGEAKKEQVTRIRKPYGIKAHKGKIYVCDLVGNVFIIDPAAKTFESLKGNFGFGTLQKPLNLTIDNEGRIYVADSVRREVLVYNVTGEFVAAYGKELGIKPVDVEVDDKYLYVLDLPSNEIKILDRSNGKYLRSIGKRTKKAEGISMAIAMTMSPDGFLYVSNAGTGRILKYDRDGHLLDAFGDMGTNLGMFARPKGLAVDEDGKIFVADAGHQNVQIFNSEKQLLMFFGDSNLNPELTKGLLILPTDVATSKDNLDYFRQFADPSFEVEELVFVVNQIGPSKVSVYGLGQLRQTVSRLD